MYYFFPENIYSESYPRNKTLQPFFTFISEDKESKFVSDSFLSPFLSHRVNLKLLTVTAEH